MFCLNGKSSVLSADFFPPIELNDDQWEIGLVDFMSYNNIPNVEKGKNNMFYYNLDKSIKLTTGMYEIEDLIVKLKHGMGDCADETEETGVTNLNRTDDEKKLQRSRAKKTKSKCILKIIVDPTTLHSRLFCLEIVDFAKPRSIRTLLGFDEVTLPANFWHMSQKPVNISSINAIRITCNIVRGSYVGGEEGHILHEFFPRVGRGYKIIEVPNSVIYLPVNTKSIHNITVRICNQNSELINFGEEEVTVRLHLRRRNNGIDFHR